MITVDKVSKNFGELTVLQDVSFVVEKNCIVGIAGASGGGKSTLLRCIQQELEKPDTGTIKYHGHAGFMFQDFQLFPHMTILQNLTYAPSLHDKKTKHEEYAKTLLTKLGIWDKADVYPYQLSGGQKQRVALARSLMTKPELLLCDEPTSGLDVTTISDVIALLKLVLDMGITIIIASHDLGFLTRIADRVLILKGSKISADITDLQKLENPVKHITQLLAEA